MKSPSATPWDTAIQGDTPPALFFAQNVRCAGTSPRLLPAAVRRREAVSTSNITVARCRVSLPQITIKFFSLQMTDYDRHGPSWHSVSSLLIFACMSNFCKVLSLSFCLWPGQQPESVWPRSAGHDTKFSSNPSWDLCWRMFSADNRHYLFVSFQLPHSQSMHNAKFSQSIESIAV